MCTKAGRFSGGWATGKKEDILQSRANASRRLRATITRKLLRDALYSGIRGCFRPTKPHHVGLTLLALLTVTRVLVTIRHVSVHWREVK